MKTYDLKLIQVLWVEDDQDAVERGQMDAYSFGLQLEAFPCWDDAKKALDEEYDRWSAIILDAKCKYHADSSDNAVRFLGEALKDISILGEKKGRIIPWYVFTGGDEGEVSDSINDDRMIWDGDWTEGKKKKYYVHLIQSNLDTPTYIHNHPLEYSFLLNSNYPYCPIHTKEMLPCYL